MIRSNYPVHVHPEAGGYAARVEIQGGGCLEVWGRTEAEARADLGEMLDGLVAVGALEFVVPETAGRN